jgi:hypothetical protein
VNLLFLLFLLLAPTVALCADAGETDLTAESILARVWANRPLKDFSLKARLFVTRERILPVEILVKNTPEEVRTIYRAGKTQLLVIQSERGEPCYYLRGAGELKGRRRTEDFLGSHFSDYDLGMPFLRWPNPKLRGEQRVTGRDCYIIETKVSGEPYARVRLWIDKEYFALLRAEAFDENENLVRRFAITSFKRIGEFWIPRGIEMAFVPPRQSLPSEEKSRLEMYEGSYDTQLPAEWFSPGSFGAESGAGKSGY